MSVISLAQIIIYLLIFVGWIANIVKLLSYTGSLIDMGVLELLRVVGILVPPLGAILGIF